MEISVDSTACSQFCDQVSCFVWRSLQTVLPAVNSVFRSAVLYGDLFRQYCLQSVLCLGQLFCMEISVDSTTCSQFCDQVGCFVWRSLQTVLPAVNSVFRSAVLYGDLFRQYYLQSILCLGQLFCMEISLDNTASSQFCVQVGCFVWRSLQTVLPAVNSVFRSAVLYGDLFRQYYLQSILCLGQLFCMEISLNKTACSQFCVQVGCFVWRFLQTVLPAVNSVLRSAVLYGDLFRQYYLQSILCLGQLFCMEIFVDDTACSQFRDQVSCFVWRSLQTVLPAVNSVIRSAVLYGDLCRQYCLQSILLLGQLFCIEISVDSTACSQFCVQVSCFVWRSLQTVLPAVNSVFRSAVLYGDLFRQYCLQSILCLGQLFCMEISVDSTVCSQFCVQVGCFVWISLQTLLPAVKSVIRSAVLYGDLRRQYYLQSILCLGQLFCMEISLDSTTCSQIVIRSAVLYGDLRRQYYLQSILCLGQLFCMEISLDSTTCSQFCVQVSCFVWRSLQTILPAVSSVFRQAVLYGDLCRQYYLQSILCLGQLFCMEISLDSTACSPFCDYVSCFVQRSLQTVLPAVNSVIRSAVLYGDFCRQYCQQSIL